VLEAAKSLAQRAARLIEPHRRQLGLAGAAILFLGSSTFGLASVVVSLAPDASAVAPREVTEEVTPLPLARQSELLRTHSFRLYRSDVTRSSDTAESLLARLGVDDAAAVQFLRADTKSQQGMLGRPGRHVTAEINESGALMQLTARWSNSDDGNFNRLVILRGDASFASRLDTPALTVSVRMGSGVIDSSLFAATDDAQIPDSVAVQLAEIFSGDIDFHRSLRKGDHFSVVYESLEADGEPLRAGRVLGAEFVNAGKAYHAMWFQDPGAKSASAAQAGAASHSRTRGGYYTLEGNRLSRAYLAAPLAFSRVSSGFRMRFHPILKKWRRHLGTDYAAPTGTPVRTVGDGVVHFAGVQNGFGKVVYVNHRNNHTTVYAHLSRIYVRRGQRVDQGDRIGAVGATGWATGAHLHFEFRVNGRHVNPRAISRQGETIPVSAAAKPQFLQDAAQMRQQLAMAATLHTASAE